MYWKPEYTDIECHEYNEDSTFLDEKAAVLADFIRASSFCVAYTGAGLRVSSGLHDYATGSRSESLQKRGQGIIAQHSVGHKVLARLLFAGYLKAVVNQSHDGLLHKAGLPPQYINELHGSWFDPSNPGGNMLRDDLFEGLFELHTKVDMCLAMGSSLSGLNADHIATPASKCYPGLAIVNLQSTPLLPTNNRPPLIWYSAR